jgi:hypothetical protein
MPKKRLKKVSQSRGKPHMATAPPKPMIAELEMKIDP